MAIILGLATVGLVILTAITWTTEDWQSVTAGLSLLPLAFAAVVLFVAWLALGCAWAIERCR